MLGALGALVSVEGVLVEAQASGSLLLLNVSAQLGDCKPRLLYHTCPVTCPFNGCRLQMTSLPRMHCCTVNGGCEAWPLLLSSSVVLQSPPPLLVAASEPTTDQRPSDQSASADAADQVIR